MSVDLRGLQQRLLQQKHIDSLYLVYGEDYYLVNEALKVIKSNVLTEGAIDFNLDQYYAHEKSVSDVLDIAEMLPVMSPRRMVIFKSVHQLKEKDWAQMMKYIEAPIDSTTLVLVGEKIDKRKKYYKALQKTACVVELLRPYDNHMSSWVAYIASQHGLELEVGVAELIHQLMGTSLAEINNELLKMAQYLGSSNKLSKEVVLKVASQSKVYSIFDLANAIANNDRIEALTCLANLLDHGQNEVGALSLISRHFRVLQKLHEYQQIGLKGTKLSAKLGVPHFFLKDYLSQSKKWPVTKINKTMSTLYETDKALKSSPVSSHIWLENFVIAATNKA